MRTSVLRGLGIVLALAAAAGAVDERTPGGVGERVPAPAVLNIAPRATGVNEVMLAATADIWLSDADAAERLTSMGKAPVFKLKTCQELAVIRFDATPVRGREVKKATLYMRRQGGDQLRRFLLSTVAQSWREGDTTEAYGKPSGACFRYADYDTRTPWAWPVSGFWDVSQGNGHTLDAWTESAKLSNGWVAVNVPVEMVYAMAADSTDGLCVMEGGTLEYYNNFLYSAQSGESAPRMVVELGAALTARPAPPRAGANPAPEKAHLRTGALRLTVAPAPGVFAYDVRMNGNPVDRWRIPYPAANGPTVMVFDDLPPGRQVSLDVVAVSAGGQRSETATVSAAASPALPRAVRLRPFVAPSGGQGPRASSGPLRVWAAPELVRIDPLNAEPVSADLDPKSDYRAANAVWDGRRVTLCGARGEYVSYQLCIERGDTPLSAVRLTPEPLTGPGGAIGGAEIELFKNWCVKPKKTGWIPEYAVPLRHGEPFAIPDPARKLDEQQNQTVTVDVYIPKDARPGDYRGAVIVAPQGVSPTTIPVELTVWDFTIPDQLAFWPEMNCYSVPGGGRGGQAYDYYQLAHQHRCVLQAWAFRPKLQGRGKDVRCDWTEYDRAAGPLLSGEAFRNNRRVGVPQPCLYLGYTDDWPGPLNTNTYRYTGRWPGRGEPASALTPHFLTAPYIGDGLSDEYKDAFLAVQRQFIEHFREKGWNRTEMQCFYGSKSSHRMQFGLNTWWTCDEPYHLDDWLALQFFCRLWTHGLVAHGGDPKIWAARADISRPWNQGRFLQDIAQCIYYGAGGFSDAAIRRRCRILAEESGFDLRTYGGGGPNNISAMLVVWLNGSDALLPWQTLGNDKCLDEGDAAGQGAGIFVPGDRFGLPVVGSLRLKEFRTGEQLIEYLVMAQDKYGLTREQVEDMLLERMRFGYAGIDSQLRDDADAARGTIIPAWQIVELRRALAEIILRK